MKKRLQKEIDRSVFKIKVVEKSGTSLVKMLQRNDPLNKVPAVVYNGKRNTCKCNKKGTCRELGVTYQIKCLGGNLENPEEMCDSFYQGETDRNGSAEGSNIVPSQP